MASSKNIDFSGVKDGGAFNRSRIPAGDYLATVSKVEDAEARDGVFQYLISIKLVTKPSSVFPYYCKLQENQLWKLRNLLIAAGLTVPKRKVKVDPNKIIGRKIGVTIEDDEYEGREQSTVAGVFPAAELADGNVLDDPSDIEAESADEPEEETEDFSMDDLEDETEEEPEADEIAGMSRAELKAEIKSLKPDFVVKKSMTDDDLRDSLTDLRSDAAPADDEDEEEEEPEPAPVKKKPVAKKRAAKKKVSQDVSDEELDELDIDDI